MGGKLNKVPDSVVWQDIIIKGSEWFYINENQAYKSLNHAFKNHSETKDKAVELMKENREKFTLSKMVQKLDEIVENYLKDTPQQVNLNLPKLKKVSKASSEPPEVKLPKLKKITKEEVSV